MSPHPCQEAVQTRKCASRPRAYDNKRISFILFRVFGPLTKITGGRSYPTTAKLMGLRRSKVEQQKRPWAQTDSPHCRVVYTLPRDTVERALKQLASVKGLKEVKIDFLLLWDSPSSGRSSDFAALLSGLVDRSTRLFVVDSGREVETSVTTNDGWSPSDDGLDCSVSAGRNSVKTRLLWWGMWSKGSAGIVGKFVALVHNLLVYGSIVSAMTRWMSETNGPC